MLDQIDTRSDIEIHLMVNNPSDYVEKGLTKIKTFIAQKESENIDEFIKKCSGFGYSWGLSYLGKTEN